MSTRDLGRATALASRPRPPARRRWGARGRTGRSAGRVPPRPQRRRRATCARAGRRRRRVRRPSRVLAGRPERGRALGDDCPICEKGEDGRGDLRLRGRDCRPAGGAPGTVTELNRLRRREEPVLCYEVEVCPPAPGITYPDSAGGRAPQLAGRGLSARSPPRVGPPAPPGG